MSSPELAYEAPRFRMPRFDWRLTVQSFAAWLAVLALRLYRHVDRSHLLSHAKNELTVAGLYHADAPYGGLLGDEMMNLMTAFSMAGHSGGSAGMASDIFNKIGRYQPLTPLTGADDEWMEVGTGVFQNKRCGRVFKDAKRGTYDIDGKVFEQPDGSRYGNSDSCVPVTFPYTPTTEVVQVPFLPSDD